MYRHDLYILSRLYLCSIARQGTRKGKLYFAQPFFIFKTCSSDFLPVIVYAHGRRLCSNWVRYGSTTISCPQCSLTFMRERYLHRLFAYAKSAVGIDVVSVHKLFAYRVVSTVSTDIVSSHTKYCRIAYGITR